MSLYGLVKSGLVALDQLIGKNLVDASDLSIPDIKLGDLLNSPLTDINDLIDKGVVDVNDLLDTKFDLRQLIDSGLTTLSDLATKELLNLADLDPAKTDLDRLTSQYAFGATTRIYYGRSDGTFDPGVDLSPDKFITRSIAIGDVDGDGHPDIVVGNVGTGRAAVQESQHHARYARLRHRQYHHLGWAINASRGAQGYGW